MKLYDIPAEIAAFEMELETGGGELTPELEQRWKDFIAGSKDKIEAAAMVVNKLEADAEICERESDRLSARQHQMERNAKRLKDLMIFAVDALGGKIKTPIVTVWCQNSAPHTKVEVKEGTDLVALEKTNPELVRVKREPNIEAAKKLAETPGVDMPDCFIVSHSNGTRYLRIK